MAKQSPRSRKRRSPRGKRAETLRPSLIDLSHWDNVAPAPLWLRIALPVLVALCTFIVFLPAIDAGFTNWDDDKVIVDNPHIRGLNYEQLQWMFSKYKMGHYHPLTWISYAYDHAISRDRYPNLNSDAQSRYVRGLDPMVFHLTNLLIHIAAVVAFYFLARFILRLSIRTAPVGTDWAIPIAAALAALFFGCHPLRVENAVWVTERRDVLSAMFLIPCLLFYLKFILVERWDIRKIALYVVSLSLFALSLFSKAWGITLPAVLLVLDMYPLRRIGGRAGWSGRRFVPVLVEKIPFFALALIFALFARAAQANQRHTMKTLAEWGIADRIAQMFYGLFWYSYKTLVPINLTPLVPLPLNNSPFALRYVLAAIVVIAVVVALLLARKKLPGLIVLAVCYAGVLSPILGIAQSGPQLVADKYAYLGCIPWAILLGVGCVWMIRRIQNASEPEWAALRFGAVALVLFGTLGMLTWEQSKKWHNSYALWSHAVSVEPECALAQMNLGLLEKQRGNVDTAIEHYRISFALDPDNAELVVNMSLALKENLPDDASPSEYDDIIATQRKAVAMRPRMPGLYFALGSTLNDASRFDEAVLVLRKCIQLRTSAGQVSHPKYHRALGTAQMRLRKWDEAATQYEKALELETKMDAKGRGVINALDRLGRIREAQGKRKEAAAYFRRILEIKPRNGPALRWLSARGEISD
ncbi:MAG: tetratricopeptide repeat protein [Planctomycetes bacterium]|nr:tetratricopeptide repeat protein [Planctomycetota bacterium]